MKMTKKIKKILLRKLEIEIKTNKKPAVQEVVEPTKIFLPFRRKKFLMPSSFVPQLKTKNLEEIFPGLQERGVTVGRRLEEELPVIQKTTLQNTNNNQSAYEMTKKDNASYSLTSDYMSSKSYDINVQTPDGSSGAALRGARRNEIRDMSGMQREETQANQTAKQYDSDHERRERARRMM